MFVDEKCQFSGTHSCSLWITSIDNNKQKIIIIGQSYRHSWMTYSLMPAPILSI